MVTARSDALSVPIPTKPTSIQPGGGFFLGLELIWGRLRRQYLRRFRPAYTRRMLAKRQGSCANCPHDIIDPRDLKPYRNVCGYWFHDEEDAFRWRNHLGLARAGLAEVICFSLLFALLSTLLGLASYFLHPIFGVPLAACVVLWLFTISFFRDPKREIPSDPDVLVSPADGTVTQIEEVEHTDFPAGRALRISIFLSVFNVHVNRAPRAGRVVDIRYFPGTFLDARNREAAVRNEQLWIDFEEIPSGRFLRVKQISGAIARRIVCWLKVGDELKAGDRFGMIKFGSRTDVLMPPAEDIDVKVSVGDRVKGGSTVLCAFKKPRAAPP